MSWGLIFLTTKGKWFLYPLYLQMNFEIVYFIYEIPAWIWIVCHCLRYTWNVYMWLFIKCYEKMKNEILCLKCYEKFEVWNVCLKLTDAYELLSIRELVPTFCLNFGPYQPGYSWFWTVLTGLKLTTERSGIDFGPCHGVVVDIGFHFWANVWKVIYCHMLYICMDLWMIFR